MSDDQDLATAAPADDIEWPFTHTFAKPADVLGQTYESITLREPTANDFLKFGVLDGDVNGERVIELIAHLTNKPATVIKAMPGLEILKLSGRLSRFFGKAGR
ncbi:phage tail assembly protein [Chelatococcus reniformis]|uniref:Phage tail assembly protein n=1 Tax=Chelatococcus reniformis TaxID=1494448 RepID=A0A916UDS7_9HYPH|nr:phage tail assembly protein [Chelatococcus reniformis]GGC68571.1 hypothetical protein GCM10010994_28960 [Chelatococcus reniformis]